MIYQPVMELCIGDLWCRCVPFNEWYQGYWICYEPRGEHAVRIDYAYPLQAMERPLSYHVTVAVNPVFGDQLVVDRTTPVIYVGSLLEGQE